MIVANAVALQTRSFATGTLEIDNEAVEFGGVNEVPLKLKTLK